MSKRSLVLVLAVLLMSCFVWAQTGQTGAIYGVVTTPEGDFIPGVRVVLKSPALVLPQMETVSNEKGMYRFLALPPGIYELSYELEGLERIVRKDIQINIGKTMTLDIAMSMRASDEVVVVEGLAPTVDRQKTVGITTLNMDLLQSVPVQRDLNNFLNMAPGVTGNTAHGSSTRENAYKLDGVNLGDPATGTQMVFFGLDVMEEISIESGGLSAEYGSVKGAVINVVSKSGGNNFSGSTSFYFNHEKLQSDNTEGTGVPSISGSQYEYEPTLTLGGPVVKDRLWFFTNLSYWRASQYVSGYPADDPDNPIAIKEIKPYPYLKLTFRPTVKDKFVLSYNYSDRRLDHRGANWDQIESTTLKQRGPAHVFNFHWTRQFNPNFFTNLKIGVIQSTLTFENKDPNQANHLDALTGIWSGSYFRALDDNPRDRYQINADATLFVDDYIGAHELKFGGELQVSKTGWAINFSRDPVTGLSYMIDYPEYYGQYGFLNYGYYIYDFERKDDCNSFGLYFNDTWSPFSWLTVNLGARFEYNSIVWPKQMEEEGPQEFMGYSFNRSITEPRVAMEWLNVVPRMGAIFDVFNDGKTLFKASFGRYLQPNITEWVNLAHPNGWFYYMTFYDWDGNIVGQPFNIQIPGSQKIGYPGYNDGKLKAPYVDEFTIGVERELFTHWSVGLRYMRKWDRNLIEDVDANQLDMDALINEGEIVWTNWVPYTAVDPYDGREVTFYDPIDPYLSVDKYIINPPGAERDYDGVEFNLRRRYAKGWQFNLSYVYQNSRGLIPTANTNTAHNSLGTSSLYETPNAHYNAEGRFEFERRHMLKLHGMVKGPWGINVSGYFRIMSGRRYTRNVSSVDLGLDLFQEVTNYAEPMGSHGLDPIKLFDIRVEKQILVGPVGLRLFCDIFNIFNDSTVIEVRNISGRADYSFGDATALVNPRIFQLGLKIEY